MARMKIFNTLEEEAFESPPVFNSAERKRFFSLPVMLKDSMANLRTPTNQVCFLVAAGYFKARRKFFARQFHQAEGRTTKDWFLFHNWIEREWRELGECQKSENGACDNGFKVGYLGWGGWISYPSSRCRKTPSSCSLINMPSIT